MSHDAICTYCGREGHTASSCPVAAKMRGQRKGSLAVLLCLVAALSFAAGLGVGRAVDAAIVGAAQLIEPLRTGRGHMQRTRWAVAVHTWMRATHHYEIEALYPESAAAIVDVMWPDVRWMGVLQVEA